MNEELLQYIWKHRLFNNNNLRTLSGEEIEIINQGTLNTDAGPDFFNASIRIGKTLWAGNVEIHTKSSDWYKHGHHTNLAYNNVILHVVWENDTEVVSSKNEKLPVFIPQIEPHIIKNYHHLIKQPTWPACSNSIKSIDKIYIHTAMQKLLVERLENKTVSIEKLLNKNQNNWVETFYQHLAMIFGLKSNELPFEMLTRSLPLKILSKSKENLFQLEAMLFGQSGLLNEQLLGDEYFLKLRTEYQYHAFKNNLKGIDAHLWKFLRLRPANFPTIRIAQFAALINQSDSLFSKLLEITTVEEVLKLFHVKASEYWDTHYRFNNVSKPKEKWLGADTSRLLVINCIVPFLYLYGERNNKPVLKERALLFLEQLPPELNNVIKRWEQLGVKPSNSYDTQALVQLKNNYCDLKQCLRCQIGNKLITNQVLN